MAGGVFAGFAVSGVKGYRLLLHAISSAGKPTAGVVFSYREKNAAFEEIRDLCRKHGIEFIETSRLDRHSSLIAGRRLAALFVAGWGYRIDRSVFGLPGQGVIVFHDSLLPKYRGFAPTFWAVINGEKETGVTAFFIDDDIDTGDIISQQKVRILKDDDINTVTEKVIRAYGSVFDRIIRLLASQRRLPRRRQDHGRATYCIWRVPEDGLIRWEKSAKEIRDLVRASQAPYYQAFTTFEGRRLFVAEAEVCTARRYVGSLPGKVESIRPGDGVYVLTGTGLLRLRRVRLEGDEEKDSWDVIKRLNTRLPDKTRRPGRERTRKKTTEERK